MPEGKLRQLLITEGVRVWGANESDKELSPPPVVNEACLWCIVFVYVCVYSAQCVRVVCIEYGTLCVVYLWPVVCLWLCVVCGVIISSICYSLSCMFVICIWHLVLCVCVGVCIMSCECKAYCV